MNAQHTPGPWDAAIQDGCHAVIASTSGGTPKAVAVVGNYTPDDGRQAERFANARLIAAAPDLLAVVKAFHEWADNQADAQSKGGHATFDLWMLREQRDLASAAIAKAERGTA